MPLCAVPLLPLCDKFMNPPHTMDIHDNSIQLLCCWGLGCEFGGYKDLFNYFTEHYMSASTRCCAKLTDSTLQLTTTFFTLPLFLQCLHGNLRVPNGVFQTVFFRFLVLACDRGKPLSEGEKMPENTSVFLHFGAFFPCGS